MWHYYFWLLEKIYIARLWTGSSGNFIAFFNSTMKNVLLSQIVFIYYFLAEARLSARARNPRLSDYNSWTSVWSRVQHQRGGLSAGSEWGVKVLRLHPAGAQNPLISSSRPDGWCRREFASLYYVEKKKEKKSSVSFSLDRKSNSQHRDFILELLLTLNLAKCSGGVEDSCTMRVVYCSCLFRIALSEVVAVLLEDLFLPSQARTLAEASKWRLFFLIDIHQCCSNPPGRCLFFCFSAFLSFHCCPVISCFRGISADHRGSLGVGVGSQFCLVFFLFFSFPTVCMRVCAAGEIT